MKHIKIILLCCMGIISSCTKMDIEPMPLPTQKIFSVNESSVTNGQTIYFDLPSEGTYILTLVDVESGQVVSREKFIGLAGENNKKIYTKSIVSKYLYLMLTSENNTQISKTKLILN